MALRKRRLKKLARKSKRTRTKSTDPIEKKRGIKEETLRGVWGVLALAFAAFFVLSGFDVAGILGSKVHSGLGTLLGIGYWLVPVSLGLTALGLFKSFETKMSILAGFGTGIFFVASLAMLETLFDGSAGIVGNMLSAPLVWAIDKVAAVVVLFAMLVAALLVVFDTHPQFAFPSIKKWFSKSTDEDADKSVLKEHEENVINKETEKVSEISLKDSSDIKDTNDSNGVLKKTTNIVNFAKNKGVELIETASYNGQNGVQYIPPPISILQKDKGKPGIGDVKAAANAIKRTLLNFNIHVEMDEVSIGPTVTRYALKPAEGVRLAKIVSLQSNLELALAVSPIRIEAPIPGKALVGIEVPNISKSLLGLASLVGHSDFQKSDKPLLITLGRDIAGKPLYANIAKMPHILIAGATGAGKSVTIHDLIISLLYRNSPADLRLLMVDPKRVELTLYNGIPHLLTPVITDAKRAILALKWLGKEMERRYDILETEGVRDIASYHENVYNKKPADDEGNKPEAMPYIVALIDELADLMQLYPREMEAAIVRLAQMSRAVGIHLVLSTQRPSVKVITGLIKANIPARIALQVASQIDSRTILDMGGAEKLLGAGDMLYLSGDMGKPLRIQAPFISETEVKDIVKHLSKAYESELGDEIDLESTDKDSLVFSASVGSDDEDDELFDEAKQTVIEADKASTSYLQRKLRVGYARAARLMDMLEERGIIGPQDGSKPRAILLGAEDPDQETDEENPEPNANV